MTRLKRIALAGAALGIIAVSGPAFADDAKTSDWTFSGNIAVTNDYVFRGWTQTNEDPAVQGGFDLSHSSGFYFGVWGSNVEFLDGNGSNATSMEGDIYGGYANKFGNSGISYDIGGIYYGYPGAVSGSHYGYYEVYLKLSADIAGLATVGTGISYSPNFFGGTGDAIYVPLNLSVPIPLGSDQFSLSASGEVGYNELLNAGQTWDGIHDNYFNWNIGLTLSIKDWFDIDVRYHDTNMDGGYCKNLCDARGTVTISRSL